MSWAPPLDAEQYKLGLLKLGLDARAGNAIPQRTVHT